MFLSSNPVQPFLPLLRIVIIIIIIIIIKSIRSQCYAIASSCSEEMRSPLLFVYLVSLSSICSTIGFQGLETKRSMASLISSASIATSLERSGLSASVFAFSSCPSSLYASFHYQESLLITMGDYSAEIEKATGGLGVLHVTIFPEFFQNNALFLEQAQRCTIQS